jgi:hypothetical protein
MQDSQFWECMPSADQNLRGGGLLLQALESKKGEDSGIALRNHEPYSFTEKPLAKLAFC